MDSRCKELLRQEGNLFSGKQHFDMLCQEMADNFYRERADFTSTRVCDNNVMSGLATSYPFLLRRTMGDTIETMLRPKQPWFEIAMEDDNGEPAKVGGEGARWAEWAGKRMRGLMYRTGSNFERAAKMVDHDYVTFGNGVMSRHINERGDGLLFSDWHLRDVAWQEGADRSVDRIYRRWKPYASTLIAMFPRTVSDRVRKRYKNDQTARIECCHIVVPSEYYSDAAKGGKKYSAPYVSVYIDREHEEVLSESGSMTKQYVIPRWSLSQSCNAQYAVSPAAIHALPDARTMQIMSLILMEAGEKAVDPPMIAYHESLREEVALLSGTINYIDSTHDERQYGAPIRPIMNDYSGIPYGQEALQEIRAMLNEAWYVNKITLPQSGGEKTAYEIGQRVQEYIRNALPIFTPAERDYNGTLCEDTFTDLLHRGAFGAFNELPREVRGRRVKFLFRSPLTETEGAAEAQKLIQAYGMAAQVAAIDPAAPEAVKWIPALRSALRGIGISAHWLKNDEELSAEAQQKAQQMQMQQFLQSAAQGGMAAEQLGKGAQALGLINPNAA